MKFQVSTLILAIAAASAANAQSTPTNPPVSPPVVTPQDQAPADQTMAPGQTQTTPGQAQTAPGQASDITPAQTGQTPSGQATADTKTEAAPVTAATAADVKAGVSVYDPSGALVGKIEKVSDDGAVLSTGKTRASIPISSFAKGDKGLVISMTKADINAQSAKATSKTSKKSK